MPEDFRTRFAANAGNYATSTFHADPTRLEEVVALCLPEADDEVLDLATGTGHTALALAPHVRRVVGLDLTPEMLAEAERLAAERRAGNVEWVLGDAHALPFADGAFDLVVARAAPHHFTDLRLALREAWRVLRAGGRLVLVDCSPPAQARDALHAVEVARDPSHVLSLTLEEWRERLQESGFQVEVLERAELDWDFAEWHRRLGLPPERIEVLARLLEESPASAREVLRPERREGRLFHRYWHARIRARKP